MCLYVCVFVCICVYVCVVVCGAPGIDIYPVCHALL